jgi:hypothetical protein
MRAANMSPATILTALLHLFPYMNGNNRQCIETQQARIISQLNDLTNNPPLEIVVPLEVIVPVAFRETHLGCDAQEGGGWGAPISASRRHTAGTHRNAARILAVGFQLCGTWDRAIYRFRTGHCTRRGLRADIAAIGDRYLRGINALRQRLQETAVRAH